MRVLPCAPAYESRAVHRGRGACKGLPLPAERGSVEDDGRSANDDRGIPRLARTTPAQPGCSTRCSAPRRPASTPRCARDHFAPWSVRQGESGFAWSWLGAALRGHATARSASSPRPASGTTRRSPRRRSPRSTSMYPGRFWAALGSGEAINEHVTGDPWPAEGRARRAAARDGRPSCVACSPARRSAPTGCIHVDRARIWSLPRCRRRSSRPPCRTETARECAEWADGLITVDQPRDALRAVHRRLPRRRRPRAHRRAGAPELGAHRRRGARDRARPVAHRASCPAHLAWELDTPEAFDEAHRRRHRSTRSPRRCSLGRPRAAPRPPRRLAELGVDRIYLHHVGVEQDALHRHVRRSRRCPSCKEVGAMKITDRSDLWWKTAVVYCLDVETYMDWNDDGSGDFEGLAHRLDHLAELGVTCIWLMPFQPTPDRDDGYDITDFTRRRPAARLPRRRRRVHAHRARPRHAGDHRLRHEPHLGPASVVQVGPAQPHVALPRLLRLARRAPEEAGADRVPRRGGQRLGARRAHRASTTCTASTGTSPT